MAEHEDTLGTMLMEGLVAFRPPLDMVKDTRAYAIMVAQYVEALVNVSCTYSELRRALRMIRRDQTDRFWPTIAEVLAAARDARAILKAEERQQSPTLLPAPEPPRRALPVNERALMGARMTVLAEGMAAGEIPARARLEEMALARLGAGR